MATMDEILALAKSEAKKPRVQAKPVALPVKRAKPAAVATPVAAPTPPEPNPMETGIFAQLKDLRKLFPGASDEELILKITNELKSSRDQSNQQANTKKEIDQFMMTRPQFEEAKSRIEDLPLPGQRGQQAANAGLNDSIEKLKEFKPEVDLTGIAGALDELFGTNWSSKIKPPEKVKDRMTLLASLQDKLANNYNAQSHFENALLNAMKLPSVGYTQLVDTRKDTTGTSQTTGTTQSASAETPKKTGGSGKVKEIDTRPLADRLDKIMDAKAALGTIEKLIPGGVDNWNGEDLPGFSMGFGAASRFFGGKPSADGGTLVQAVQRFNNMVMKARSGGAITDSEMERLSLELGTGIFKNSKDLVNALRDSKAAFNEIISNRAGGEKPGTLEAYLERRKNPNVAALQGIGESGAPMSAPVSRPNGADLLKRMRESRGR